MDADKFASLEQQVADIRKRNARVEADKAWETSSFRVIVIGLLTYATAMILIATLPVHQFWLNALIPVAGFMLSTLSLPEIKHWWIEYRYKKARTSLPEIDCNSG